MVHFPNLHPHSETTKRVYAAMRAELWTLPNVYICTSSSQLWERAALPNRIPRRLSKRHLRTVCRRRERCGRDHACRRQRLAAARPVSMRALDVDGREVHSAIKGDTISVCL
jgi:hypothetical protein